MATNQKIPLDVALAKVTAAEQRLATASGVVPLEDMTVADSRVYAAIADKRQGSDRLPVSQPTFQNRLAAEVILGGAVADYIHRAGGEDQRIHKLGDRLLLRGITIRAGLMVDGGISPSEFTARKQRAIGRVLGQAEMRNRFLS